MAEAEKMSTQDDFQWSDKELLDFATALQRFGSADTKKIAFYMKTRSVNEVKAYIAFHTAKFHKKVEKGPWPALSCWQKIAQDQQAYNVLKKDYSMMIIPQVWERFSEEADEPTDKECVNMKKVYWYVAQCLHGNNPPELPPKESATLLMYMRLVRHALSNMDLTDEKKFLQEFEKATTYVPVQEKAELENGATQVSPAPGTQPIPEDVYASLSHHRHVVQSFNPLAVPAWLLEQESLLIRNPCSAPTQEE